MAFSSAGPGRRPPVVIPGDDNTSNNASASGASRPTASRPVAGPSAGSARVVMPGAGGAQGSGAIPHVQRPYSNTIGVNACQVSMH